jgi:hypothetical protein
VVKVREAELPAPHVVLEVMYTPQQNPQIPNFTPGEVRQEHTVVANQEQAFREHLTKSSPLACHVQLPPAGTCAPGNLVVSVPQFVPSDTAMGPQGPGGCAQIESQAAQDSVRQQLGSGEALPQVFRFEESSAQLPSDASQLVSAVATQLSGDAEIQCVAIVGLFSPVESLSVANERARAVHQALLSAGIDPSRLTVIPATQAVFGAGTARQPDPEKQKVNLRILLRSSAQ